MTRGVSKRERNYIKLPIKLLKTNCPYFVSSLKHEYLARNNHYSITSIVEQQRTKSINNYRKLNSFDKAFCGSV